MLSVQSDASLPLTPLATDLQDSSIRICLFQKIKYICARFLKTALSVDVLSPHSGIYQ